MTIRLTGLLARFPGLSCNGNGPQQNRAHTTGLSTGNPEAQCGIAFPGRPPNLSHPEKLLRSPAQEIPRQ